MQETSHWPTHRWNVMSEQRKSDWQHPNSYYRKREETEHAATDESDTSRHPQPFRTIPTKAVQVMPDPGRDVTLEALHFLVEIGNPRHRFIPMVARRSTTAWEILWSRPTEVLDGHCVPFARPKYRRQPLGPPQWSLLARSVGSLPCSDTSGVGGKADMPRQLGPTRLDPERKSSNQFLLRRVEPTSGTVA